MRHAVHHLLATLFLLASAAAFSGTAHAAQSYDNCTGFIDSVPATISTQGVWCLRKDLSTNVGSGAAITINANNVTIDCNDFKLGGLAAGTASLASGISASNRQNATVRHCNVRGFFAGIDFRNGAGHLVEDNRFDNNLFIGISIWGDNNLVQRNRVHDTGGGTNGFGDAIGIDVDADVIDNTVEGVFGTAPTYSLFGIKLIGAGRVARNNRVRGMAPAGAGLAYGIYTGYARITFDGNHVISEATISGTGIRGATSYCRNNTVAGFTTAASGCEDVGGNAGF
ncbi:MAG: right-handed parallel beta-helix repeat-containing protein [Luteimonas sp.]|nr:right-handed parallel beta-helix repeat-containing protein [Luteimonas sp.]